MKRFYSAQSSQKIDQYAINTLKIPGILLMKRAGLFAFDCLQHHYPKASQISLLCGTGNNGGDGFIVAQLCTLAGLTPVVYLLGDATQIKGDALIAYQEMLALGITPHALKPRQLKEAEVIIDALFGTGLDRPITGDYLKAIQLANQSKRPIIALDIASGLHADTGAALGDAIQATHTCTFITRKLGLYTYQGPDHSGHIHYSNLFLEKTAIDTQSPLATSHTLKHWLNQLPKRLASFHKGLAGSALLIGGNHNMMGAIQLAANACLKSGAGLVKVVTKDEHALLLTQQTPEIMAYSEKDFKQDNPLANAVAIGPGLGSDKWAKDLFQQALDLALPKVLDADALKLLAEAPRQQHDWVLTPHPGEAATLLHTDSRTIQQDRINAIKTLHTKYGGVIVLKGNGTLIYDGQQMELCTKGNPGMAVGGMGDTLTGMITTFLAQGLSPWQAACIGVHLHAEAGDILAQQNGQAGVLPSELADVLSQLLSYQD